MFHLKEYKNRFRIPVSEWNKLASFINNLAGGAGVTITKPDVPSASTPVTVSISNEGVKGITEDIFFISGYSQDSDKITLCFSKMTIEDGVITSIERDHGDEVHPDVDVFAY